jgi:endoglucanase Acf2
VWTHPYSVCWAKGAGNAKSWGLSISQVDREQLAFGPATPSGASQYYINPVGEFELHDTMIGADLINGEKAFNPYYYQQLS